MFYSETELFYTLRDEKTQKNLSALSTVVPLGSSGKNSRVQLVSETCVCCPKVLTVS